MSATASANDAINAARSVIATDVANVGAAINTAIDDMDGQLATLHDRREELERALVAIGEQITRTDEQRAGLIGARGQLVVGGDVPDAPADDNSRAEASTGAGSRSPASAANASSSGSDDEEWEYVEVDEAELHPDVPRTKRLVTILSSTEQEMTAAELTEILNSYGDDTTVKVVSGTLSNLARRDAVRKAGNGMYAIGNA